MTISFAQATQTMLAGDRLEWHKFRDHKAGSITLDQPVQRRLFAYLLAQDAGKVAQGSEELFEGLTAAWSDKKSDPATQENAPAVENDAHVWRLERIEASGFGGLTLFGGEPFDFWISGDNWCLLGQNGSGKTSLASAALWALTGKRIREQDGPIDESGLRAPVTNAEGKKIGEWPPFASYPTAVIDLIKPVDVWVRLSFKNEKGELASAYRRMVCPAIGVPTRDVEIDPRLLRAPQLIETGLLMPARLARIGFGEKSQSLYEAVKVLTGLDQLADISDGCVHFTHGARRFLKFGKDNGIDGFRSEFDENIAKAVTKSAELQFKLTQNQALDGKTIEKDLKDAAAIAAGDAGTHMLTLKSEIATSIDTATAQGRVVIRNAVATARGVVNQGTSGIAVFAAWDALQEAGEFAPFSTLPEAIAGALAKLKTALSWHVRQTADKKFRLKALAAQFFVPPHDHSDPAHCPICEGLLNSEKQRQLAKELSELQKDSAEAERQIEDVCRALGAALLQLIPQGLNRHADLLADMNPRDAYSAAVRERFCASAPFQDVLTGLAIGIETVVAEQYTALPPFTHAAFLYPESEPPSAIALRKIIHGLEGLVSLVNWWSSNRQQFRDAWTSLIGKKQGDGTFPMRSIEAKLATLEQAMMKADPLDELSKILLTAAAAAVSWAGIAAEQRRREAIAEALEPLKDLRALVAAETASSISSLSGRMNAILERIHLRERLTYEQTSLEKKAVTVSGSFQAGMQIDAALVANTSWLRAILWAFVFALREQTIEILGGNPFPLMVLDDPQTTFDPRNKRKWAQELARLANFDRTIQQGIQLFITTHERQFYQCMVDNEKLVGEQGLIGGVNKSSGVAKIINGGFLERVYKEALDNNNDEKAREYISDVRIYCEDLLKFMLRGEKPNISGLNLGDLREELKHLKAARTRPFDRAPFADLLNTLGGGGGKPMNLINDSHHKDDETIGVAQATDVKAFWEKILRAQIHDAFAVYDTFESYYGEPRIFPWAKNIVAFPAGFRDDVKAMKFMQTGIAAAAKTDGVAGDGVVTVEEWEDGITVVLPNHEIYQLAAGTLDPVAAIGDLLIVCNHAKIHPRNLVIASVGESLLARRYNEMDAHPEIAILTGQSVDPTALVEPVIIAPEASECRKIVGTLFAAHLFPKAPPLDKKRELVPIADAAIIRNLLVGSRLFQVKGRSAEPIALDGQFLITRESTTDLAAIKALNRRPIVAVDESGTRYFKRLCISGPLMVLESLNQDGTTAAEILSADGELGIPKLTHALEVLGVLFELPGSKSDN